MGLLNIKGTNRVMFLASLLLMAMIYSCATQDDFCHAIVPCDLVTCPEYCQKRGYVYPYTTYCKPGEYYPSCCCRQLSRPPNGSMRRLLLSN